MQTTLHTEPASRDQIATGTATDDAKGPWLSRIPAPLLVALATALVLSLFINKAVHIDDPLFLRIAQQIQQHPFDPFGTQMNWVGTTRPMIDNFENPPLTSYYIALVAAVVGWSEWALHLAFMVPAIATALGVFFVARLYSQRPGIAAVAGLTTPVFVVSATTLMCDVAVLAFWVWAVFAFEKGLRTKRLAHFVLSGMLMGAAIWTKFIAVGLIPLLVAYAIAREKRAGAWLVAPTLCVAAAALYEYATFRIYGKGLLVGAAGYSSQITAFQAFNIMQRQVIGLVFLGGCFLPLLFFAPVLWTRKRVIQGLVLAGVSFLVAPFIIPYKSYIRPAGAGVDWLYWVQTAVFLMAGFHVMCLAAADFWERRDPTSLLLVLWILGIFIFTTSLNWTINARSLLPIVPAVGILVARRPDRYTPGARQIAFTLAGLGAAALSVLISHADYEVANSSRLAAKELCSMYGMSGRTVWFQSHWGFQYYMEMERAKALEKDLHGISPGDVIMIPVQGVNRFTIPETVARHIGRRSYDIPGPFSTMNRRSGAGFYASTIGLFPFCVASRHLTIYEILEVLPTAPQASAFPHPPPNVRKHKHGLLGRLTTSEAHTSFGCATGESTHFECVPNL